MQRHSQVDPGVPQHQVRVPYQDEPHLNQSGRRQQQHPHTQTITAEVSEGGILQGAAEYQSFQRVGLWSGMLPRERPCQTSSSYSSSFCWLKKTHQHKSSGSYLIVHLKPVSYGSVLSEEAIPCQAGQ